MLEQYIFVSLIRFSPNGYAVAPACS